MKAHIYTLLFPALSSQLATAESTKDLVRLTFDDTTICAQSKYVPGLSTFGKYLKENVKGLDESGQSQTIILPDKLIMTGVEGYEFSHINKYKVDLEHDISGIANGLSEITGNPEINMPCEDEYDLGYCYQRVIYKSIFFQYTLKTEEAKNKEKVQKYLYSLFEKWESNCNENG